MPCEGHIGDYLCQGWRIRAEAIRARDGQRCRNCERDNETIQLQVHHWRYGSPGQCGNCYLTGIEDADLITLCIECHEAVTSVRRAIRYRSRVIEVTIAPDPPVSIAVSSRAKVTLRIEPIADPPPAKSVSSAEAFNPFPKE